MSESVKREVVIQASLELIGEMLHIPEGHRIVSVLPMRVEDYTEGKIRLIIEGPSLPPTPRGEKPPEALLEYTKQPALLSKLVVL